MELLETFLKALMIIESWKKTDIVLWGSLQMALIWIQVGPFIEGFDWISKLTSSLIPGVWKESLGNQFCFKYGLLLW